MGQTVRIPIEDGGWIEVDETDPRAIGYMKRFKSEGVPQRSASPVRHQRIARSGIYTVQPGDTLGNIAKDLLGDTRLFSKIAELNQLPDPNLILVGQHLVIPERAASAGTAPNIEPGGASAAKPPSTSGQAPVTPLAKPKNMSAAAGGTPATLALARGFQFVFFEQLPEIGAATRIIRKVAIIPKNYAFPSLPGLGPRFAVRVPGVGSLSPRNPIGTVTPAEHMLNFDPAGSPFLSASDRAIASGSIEGVPLLIDVAKIKAAGGQVMSVNELVAELAAYAAKNPARDTMLQKLIWSVSKIEGEVLIRGGVPRGAAARITSSAHLGHIGSAEGLWKNYQAGAITKAELEVGLEDLGRAYSRARVFGRVGRVFTVVGVVFTAYDLEQAGKKSLQEKSYKPIAAEAVRQIGGWGGAAAGAKIGSVLGAACGVETGPGAIVTGAIGAIIFGGLGYFGADLIADQISPN